MSLETAIAFLQKERENLMKAPFAFAMLSVIFLVLGYSAGILYYSSQIGSLHEQISTKDGQLGRYRVALGITAVLAAIVFLTCVRLRKFSNSR